MKTVKVIKPYLKYEVGSVIEVRDQDAVLLIPRGVVKLHKEAEPKAEAPKEAKKMTTKNVSKSGK